MENGNNQAQPVATPPAAAEPTPAELQAKIAELEKQSEGRLRDLQSERKARQEAEARATPTAPASSAPKDVEQDELGKVLKPYLAPIEERARKAEAFVANTFRDKALELLASKTGKSKEAVIEDKDLDNKLTSIVKRYALTGNVLEVTQRACDIMDLEDLRTREVERKRVADASGSASLPTGTAAPLPASSKEYSEEDWTAMPLHEYEKLSNSGSFHQGKDGKIVFTPNPK